MEKFRNFYAKNRKRIILVSTLLLILLFVMPFVTTRRMKIHSSYTRKEDVALYIMQYHELPPNYITHYGMEYAQEKHIDVSFYVMGGDTHFNTAQLDEFGVGMETKLKECDIRGNQYQITGARGRERLVYTCNEKQVRVFYTSDHYVSFEELTSFSLNLTRNIFWIIFGVYAAGYISFYIVIAKNKRKELPFPKNNA